MKKTFTTFSVTAALAVLLMPTTAQAFGEVGRWSSGWGQGTTEYTVVDAKRNALYIACSDSAPVTMTLTFAGKEYGSYAKQGFDLIIDGSAISTPYETSSRVGSNNFRYTWDALRKAKTLEAKTADGRLVALPLVGAAKTLPATKSRDFPCHTAF